jgi:hypothetical protein
MKLPAKGVPFGSAGERGSLPFRQMEIEFVSLSARLNCTQNGFNFQKRRQKVNPEKISGCLFARFSPYLRVF